MMDGWIREFDITFVYIRSIKQSGTTVMRKDALVAWMKLSSNMATPGTEPGSRG